MTTLNLKRIAFTREGVFGVLCNGPFPWLCTLEDPWNMNEKENSCIPKGVYECKSHVSHSHGATFILLDVPGRTDILFHAGNTIIDTRGCILLGMGFGEVNGLRGVKDSRAAISNLMDRMKNIKKFYLSIEE